MIRELVRSTRQAIERRMSLSDFDAILDMLASGGSPSYTGKMVGPRNAMGVIAVWDCVSILADDFAALPLPVNRWIEPGVSREQARDHYLWHLFMEEANPHLSAFEFKQSMEAWRNLWGNCYAEMEMNGRGQIVNLWPWRPDRVKVWLENPNDPRSNVWYSYIPMNTNQKPITLPADRMFHVRNISLDGIVGMSPIEVHRQTLGISMAQTENRGRFYGNGMTVKGSLTHPGKISDKALNSLKDSMKEYTGLQNSHRLLILEEGMEYKDVGMKMDDAQWVEDNKMTGHDICRIFKMPLHKVGYMEDATNNNIEQLSIDYVACTRIPIDTNWCGRIHHSMLSARDMKTIFVDPDYSKLMMADATARAAYYNAMKYILSPDQILNKEGYNPLPNGLGKFPRVPLNTAPMDSEAAKTGIQGAGKPGNPDGKSNNKKEGAA